MDLISKKLDYTLYSNAERASQVNNLFSEEETNFYNINFERPSIQKDLEKIANFILYGKDPKTDKNFCQKGEIQIETAHSTYKKKEPESLDALLEDPATHETDFQPLVKNLFRKVKDSIDREKDKAIPGIQELWKAIDKLDKDLKNLKEKGNLGIEYYRKNHLLIELRKEQYALKDTIKNLIGSNYRCPVGQRPFNFSSDTGYLKDNRQELVYFIWLADHYREQKGENWYIAQQEEIARRLTSEDIDNWTWVEVSENSIDLTNPVHVYNLIEMYGTLKENSYEDLECDMKYLLWELEDCIDKSNLSEARKYILIRKIDKATNEQIRDELQEKFGLNYNDNYISTIYKQMICSQIAATAKLILDEWIYRNQPERFKVCSTCGKKLLRDNRNFIKKQNSKDGLAARCKICDKQKREEKKKKGE